MRLTFAILLGLIVLQPLAAQAPLKPDKTPSVSIVLPPGIPSETVQISYFSLGPGGYATQTEPRAGLQFYEIPTSLDGKAVTEIKIIVYATGCEIQTFDISLAEDSKVTRDFTCQRVSSVTLSGQIVPSELVQNKKTRLDVTYMAFWDHEFFGFADGPVTEFHLATVSPDANGMFQVDLPHLSAHTQPLASEPGAGFSLMLCDAETGDFIAELQPEIPQLKVEAGFLRIQWHYPEALKFTAWPETPVQ